jgi:hypothetical protein
LVEARQAKPTRDTQFPIFEHETVQKRKGGKTVTVPVTDEIARLTKGVTRDDRTFIEKSQPYQDGRYAPRHPLALLGYLNNTDKHRFIHPAYCCAAAQRVFPPSVIYDDQGVVHFEQPRPVPIAGGGLSYLDQGQVGGFGMQVIGMAFPRACNDDVGPVVDDTIVLMPRDGSDDRTEIMHARLTPTGPNPLMEMDRHPAVTVSLSDLKRPVLLWDLVAIRDAVVGILDRFSPIIG